MSDARGGTVLHNSAQSRAAVAVRDILQEIRQVATIQEAEHGAWLTSMADQLDKAIEAYVEDVLKVVTTPTPGKGRIALVPSQTKSVCYVIRNERTGQYKIGHSVSPKSRIWHLQKEAGQDMTIVLELAGGQETERTLHTRFAAARLEGEWFAATPELTDWILEQWPEHGKKDG